MVHTLAASSKLSPWYGTQPLCCRHCAACKNGAPKTSERCPRHKLGANLLLTSASTPHANPCCRSRKQHGTAENAVAVPPLFKTALVWGLFMGVSSNLRYQVRGGVNSRMCGGVERTVRHNCSAGWFMRVSPE